MKSRARARTVWKSREIWWRASKTGSEGEADVAKVSLILSVNVGQVDYMMDKKVRGDSHWIKQLVRRLKNVYLKGRIAKVVHHVTTATQVIQLSLD